MFAKAARAPVQVDADLADQVERLLAQRVLDGLGLARRAGQVAMGFEQVRTWLRSSSAAILVTAADGAADGREKLRRLAPHLPMFTALSRTEMGAALGRESLVHVAVGPGGLARRLLRDAARLAGFRPGAPVLPDVMLPPDRIESRETTGLR
jgi:ribosomal protein L7Ae-like RNA K-turn-binding protein